MRDVISVFLVSALKLFDPTSVMMDVFIFSVFAGLIITTCLRKNLAPSAFSSNNNMHGKHITSIGSDNAKQLLPKSGESSLALSELFIAICTFIRQSFVSEKSWQKHSVDIVFLDYMLHATNHERLQQHWTMLIFEAEKLKVSAHFRCCTVP